MNEQAILAVLRRIEACVEAGYDAPESQELRAELRANIPSPTPEEALAMLPWVGAFLEDLVRVAQAGGLLPPDDPNDGAVLTP